jgi:hypothetical protein
MHTTIILYTSASDAVRSSCQHGWHPVQIDTSTLSAEERELLAQSVVERDGARYSTSAQGATWSVAPPTAEGLVEHLRGRLRKAQKQQQEDARQLAEDVAKVAAELARLRNLPPAEHVHPVSGPFAGQLIQHDVSRVIGFGHLRAMDALREVLGLDRTPASEYLTAEGLGIDVSEEQERVRAELQRRVDEQMRAAEAANAEQERKAAAERAEREAWIGEHGSEHVRACLAEGYDVDDLYVAERIALERSGWTNSKHSLTDADKVGREHDPSELPTLEQLRSLQEVRREVPDVELVECYTWTRIPDHEDADSDGDVRGADLPLLACTHVGRRLYRLP